MYIAHVLLAVLCLFWSAAEAGEYQCYKCEDGFYIFRWRCYKEMTDPENRFSIEEARAGCEALGAELVSIGDQYENDFVTKILSPTSFLAWIGLELAEEFPTGCDLYCRRALNWTWADPSTNYEDYQNWFPMFPSPDTSCGLIGREGMWAATTCTGPCARRNPGYVCEKAAVKTKFCSCDCEKVEDVEPSNEV